MSKQNIANFTANLEVTVKGIKNLRDLEKTANQLPKRLDKVNTAAHSMRSSIAAGSAEMKRLSDYTKQANQVFGDFAKKQRAAAKDPKRIADVKKRMQRAAARTTSGGPSGFASWSKGIAGLEYQAKQKQAEVLEKMQQRFNRAERKRENDKTREATAANRTKIQQENRRHQITMQNLRREAAEMRKRMLESRLANLGNRVGGSGGNGNGRGVGRPASMFGGAAGGMMGGFQGLVGGVAAGYGLASLNRQNQDIIGARLTTQAVMESTGYGAAAGDPAFDWLKGQAQRLGFSYMDSAQDYNSFLANSLGAGNSLESAQDVFKGFSEYGRAMHLSPYRTKLVMNALSQMQGKGVVSMEELRRQMAESMPGTMDIFANAYQQMTGGKETGQKAIAKLIEDVSNGRVDSSAILPLVAAEMSRRAQPSLEKASKTSQAEQGRLSNVWADSIQVFSEAGFESGMARIFKSLAQFLETNVSLIEALGRGFDRISKIFNGFLTVASWIVDVLERMAKSVGISSEALFGMMGVAVAMMLPFGKLFAMLTGIMLILEDFYVYSQGGVSVIGHLMEGIEGADGSGLLDLFENFKGLALAIVELNTVLGELFTKLGGAASDSGLLGMAFNYILEKLNTMIERLTLVTRAMSQLASGEFKLAFNTIGEYGNQVIDDLLLNPEKSRDRVEKDFRGKGASGGWDTPSNKIEGGVTFQINGATDPNAVAEAVEQKLGSLFNMTISNIPESYA